MSTAATAEVTLDRRLQFGDFRYDYYIRSGPGAWDELGNRLGPLNADRFALVVSKGVPDEFVQRMTVCLQAAAAAGRAGVSVITVPDGENTKTLTAVNRMAAALFKNGFSRRSVIVAFGGGKAANMAGLLAALTLRGVRLVHVPTTWLSLWDGAGASMKQAVNLFDEQPPPWSKRAGAWIWRMAARLAGRRIPADDRAVGKNLLGTFWCPQIVFGITDVMRELPAVEIRSAIGEVVKSVFAVSPDQMPALSALLRPEADYTVAELVQIARICVDAKQSVMRHDPHEKGDALACEWGHTFGHVIELKWRLPHGLAVLLGCLIAVRVSVKLGYLDPSVELLLEDMARRAGAPLTLPDGPSDREILAALYADNKRGYLPEKDGYVDLVLLDDLGVVHQTDGVPITQVPEAIALEAFRSRISAKKEQAA